MTDEKKERYCFECGFWNPAGGNREHDVYGKCTDIKKKTMRLDFCEEGKGLEADQK
jgi:hypothetical protein